MAELENILAKFGGSSVADAAGNNRCADIVLGATDGQVRRYVVVSAPGARHAGDSKVTDLLIQLGKYELREVGGANTFDAVVGRFSEIINGLQIEEPTTDSIANTLRERLQKGSLNNAEFKDRLHALGEEEEALIFAALLQKRECSAEVFLPQNTGFYVTPTFGDARVLPQSFRNIEEAVRGYNGIAVFPGYFGVTQEGGRIVTFQRGGSDTVGSIMANAMGVRLYENWTDQDGIGVLSPKVRENGHGLKIMSIDQLTYEEAVMLANAGFNILHPDAIKPAKAKLIPMRVRNSMNPSHPGTLIAATAEPSSLVTGIAYKGGFVSVSYRNPFDIELQNDVITGLREAFSQDGIRPALITSQNGESLIYDAQKLNGGRLNQAIQRVIGTLRAKRPDLSEELDGIELDVTYGISLVSVVGRGMAYDRRVADAKIFAGVQASGIDARLVSDEAISKTFLIRENPMQKEPLNAITVAVALYEQFSPS